ncbi:WhiB family transcriptional regulator [Kitasatospora sp. NPDC058170]|uniref:WhiB family transcriptional regulator n=1 Tax=Kitasatospora sp. NPDC058170 TaxID=3346364 RepID=UPI0036D8133E
MSAHIVRRGIRGTVRPTPTGRPGGLVVEILPAPGGGLPGAACTGVDPDLFFPADDDEFSERRARQICAGCPVRERCLALAIKRGEPYGIFGGLDETERRALAQRRRRAATRKNGSAA